MTAPDNRGEPETTEDTLRLVARLAGYLRPYAVQLFGALVLLGLTTALDMVGPYILKDAVDGPIAHHDSNLLRLLTVLYVASLLGLFVLRYVQGVLLAHVSQRLTIDVRMRLFTHLQRMSVAFFDRNTLGRLVTRLTNDVTTIEQMVTQAFLGIINSVLTMAALIVVLALLSWPLALVVYALLPLMVIASRYFAVAQRDSFRAQRTWIGRINAHLNEVITGITVIQLFNRQRTAAARFRQNNHGLLSANLQSLAWYAIFEPAMVLLGAITIALILWYGGGRVVQATLTLGTLVAFIQYSQRLYSPLRDFADRYTAFQAAMASAERVFAVLDEPEEVVDVANPAELPSTIEGRIEFRDAWFAYEPGNWVLRGISFTVEPGEKVALVGATGSGKSTMMSLLNRFYDLQEGEILVDGIPITRLRQRELRRNVGLVLQDPFIFTDTVAENIRIRDSSIGAEDIKAAASAVGADRFITALRDGYDTVLAERGANLSTGQKQLVALARVAAFRPRIVVVMDEATAGIDPETEAAVQRGIGKLVAGRTSIVIAHRLNTIRNVDRIIVLDRGRIAEMGTNDELLAKRGLYHRLYELQYREQEAEVG